ncbi:hypothetical protein [Candidatus Magnetominusculus dajiuhuensis]|uniref:hypothetical protein n=1 Tax=Candidatus Magnetominusculus dajiuhuensis TaxID=3137712 RepID=UPI003B43958A
MNYTKGETKGGKTVSWLLLLLTAAVLTVSLSSPCFSESKKGAGKGKEKEISKEETFAYIKERCTIDNDNAETKDNVFLEGCMFISETRSYDNTSYMHRRYAPLDKLNPESPTPGVWPSTNGVKYGLIANSISYTTSDEAPLIKYIVDGSKDRYHNELMQNYGYFQCESETKAKQAAKALKHLIKLCGGTVKKDLFDDEETKQDKETKQKD